MAVYIKAGHQFNIRNGYLLLLLILLLAAMTYSIAGKFGGQNVWRIYYFQAFGGKKFDE